MQFKQVCDGPPTEILRRHFADDGDDTLFEMANAFQSKLPSLRDLEGTELAAAQAKCERLEKLREQIADEGPESANSTW